MVCAIVPLPRLAWLTMARLVALFRFVSIQNMLCVLRLFAPQMEAHHLLFTMLMSQR